jgi:type II secretory pathway component PulM
MSKDETARELEKLRADVAALSDARREAAAKPAEPQSVVEEAPVAELSSDSADLPEVQKTQLEELGDLLQAEIRDLPTITCLTVFSLGILMGRLMR